MSLHNLELNGKIFIRKCEFCGREIESKIKSKRFCNDFCQRRHYYRTPERNKRVKEYGRIYNQRPEVKEKNRLRIKEYRMTHPEWKVKHRLLARKYKEKRSEYGKKYFKRPDVRERINKKRRLKIDNDINFAIADRFRRSLNHAMTKYSKTGKIMSSEKYGINWTEIVESLKPFPDNIKEHEIDHIIPLHTFNLTDSEQVKKAFAPSNLQWLTIVENRRKSGKYPTYINTSEEKKLVAMGVK